MGDRATATGHRKRSRSGPPHDSPYPNRTAPQGDVAEFDKDQEVAPATEVFPDFETDHTVRQDHGVQSRSERLGRRGPARARPGDGSDSTE